MCTTTYPKAEAGKQTVKSGETLGQMDRQNKTTEVTRPGDAVRGISRPMPRCFSTCATIQVNDEESYFFTNLLKKL